MKMKMKTENKTPMDSWIKSKIGLEEKESLLREDLDEYQFNRIKETIAYAKKNSRFYANHLKEIKESELISFENFPQVPFTSPGDIMEKVIQMVCVKQEEISRIVTLDTSGSTGRSKRIFFTEEDQELTIDFFDYGMRNIIGKEDKVLILMPYERPGSIGDLLEKGIKRFGAEVVKFGFIGKLEDLPRALNCIEAEKVTSIVGTPRQVERLSEALKDKKNGVETVLLSAEYVDEEVKNKIQKNMNCKVFEHYGMTEMGLGGSVSCFLCEGSHIREGDLYFEIINPETSEVMPKGQWGEIVFTTLTRKAMPLIRYKTGDIGRILPEPCKCGSVLNRLDRVRDRGIRKNYENW